MSSASHGAASAQRQLFLVGNGLCPVGVVQVQEQRWLGSVFQPRNVIPGASEGWAENDDGGPGRCDTRKMSVCNELLKCRQRAKNIYPGGQRLPRKPSALPFAASSSLLAWGVCGRRVSLTDRQTHRRPAMRFTML